MRNASRATRSVVTVLTKAEPPRVAYRYRCARRRPFFLGGCYAKGGCWVATEEDARWHAEDHARDERHACYAERVVFFDHGAHADLIHHFATEQSEAR